jgi:hypothetical protein
MTPRLDIAAALVEVQTRSEGQIEYETACKWAARAVACYQLHQKTGELRWLLRAEDNRHEAFEHAALIGDGGAALQQLQISVDGYRPS